MGCHALHQGIFLTQGSNPRLSCLLHWQVNSLPLAVKNPPATWETRVQSLGWEDPLAEGMATHSSIPA